MAGPRPDAAEGGRAMTREERPTFQPVATLMGIVLPGLGQCWLGEWKRGVLVFAGIMGLFLGGMLVGGIDVIDRVEDKWWFVLQAGVGPAAFAVDSIHQNVLKVPDPRAPGIRKITPPPETRNPSGTAGPPRIRKSLGRVNEVGSLYAAMAGMLNMIAVLDAAWRRPLRGERRRSG